MKGNKKGSALLWAVIVVMVLEIVIAASMTIAYSYYKRSVENNNKRQAYLTSKGIIVDIVDKIEVGDTNYLNLFKDLDVGESTLLTITMPANAKMGTSRGKIEVNDPKDLKGYITITVTTNYAEQTDTIKADMQLGKKDDVKNWQLVRYYTGDPLPLKKVTSTVEANTMWDKMFAVNNAFKNGNNTDALNVLKSDEESWNRMISEDSNWGKSFYFNNDKLRNFFYVGYYAHNLPYFVEDNLGDDVPNEVRTYVKNNKLRIEPFFTHDTYNTCIVFASVNQSFINGTWGNVRMIYNHDDGHWYYLKKVILMTIFNKDTPDHEKWKDFVKNTLSDPDKAIRLD